MKMIKSIQLAHMKSQALCAFFNSVETLIKLIYDKETCEIALGFMDASQAYELTLEGCSVEEAEMLQLADDAADDAWGALNDQIRASLRHPNAERRAAAVNVFMTFAEFSNPTRLNYDEEYAMIREQLTALQAIPRKTLELALIDEHVDALDNAHKRFMEVLAFVKDGSHRPSLCKKAREAAIDAYKMFVETLTVMARINSDEKYGRLIDGINDIIGRTKA